MSPSPEKSCVLMTVVGQQSTARSSIATCSSDQQKHENRKICPCVSRAIGVVTIDTLYRVDAA
jgi:hypothetical protein